jgi:hypothetical protein
MKPSLFFSAFEPLHETPAVCDVCDANPPILSYEFATYKTRGEAEEKKGFCCAHCSTILLHILEREESQKWAQEKAILRADESDVADFRQRRLTAFQDNGNHRA